MSNGEYSSVLRFENVSVSFDGEPALRDVSFESREGESRVILGAAGSGKTVLLKTAMGLVRELGPVLTALLVAGRNASGIASELGSMKVTEQIDAMRALGTDPIQKLVTPRMIATCVMLPCLTVVADFVGLFGGFVIAFLTLAWNINIGVKLLVVSTIALIATLVLFDLFIRRINVSRWLFGLKPLHELKPEHVQEPPRNSTPSPPLSR